METRVRYAIRSKEKVRRMLPLPDKTDTMSGLEFQRYVTDIVWLRGHEIEREFLTGGKGADSLTRDPWGRRVAWQIKKTSPWKKAGSRGVDQAFIAKAYWGADQAVAVTSSSFTSDARDRARKVGVGLWERKRVFTESWKAKKGITIRMEAKMQVEARFRKAVHRSLDLIESKMVELRRRCRDGSLTEHEYERLLDKLEFLRLLVFAARVEDTAILLQLDKYLEYLLKGIA